MGTGPEVCADVAVGGAIAGCGGASGTVSGACPAAVPQNNPKHSNTETVFRRSVCMPNPGAITVQVLPGFLSEGVFCWQKYLLAENEIDLAVLGLSLCRRRRRTGIEVRSTRGATYKIEYLFAPQLVWL